MPIYGEIKIGRYTIQINYVTQNGKEDFYLAFWDDSKRTLLYSTRVPLWLSYIVKYIFIRKITNSEL